ncbi:type II toxin-antitoxin system RelE/ParE family toxin [Flavobacterium subsaxonicum]|uniref:Plasmid stabilization protein n=1 Tax=Flavobacterium subsaxonicum WB 4.1-42 = DSM 21790 TaxID=1121898 RepID=A0A0A2ML87_9FLAO|nr:type II toxin-antitoxin system RelE/ParE family toxin [Flavobacterium subsaxonicum]KGO92341.1 hypothetical protein Q766_12795 [Flavobacterium subsaxonicum WB 4.1-42 = DSM 21790]
MKIKILQGFSSKFNKQLNYIALDKPAAARKFRNDVLLEIEDIIKMPYKNRRSIYFADDNIRDLIFKGYIIIYRIKSEVLEIEIFGFIKYTDNPY